MSGKSLPQNRTSKESGSKGCLAKDFESNESEQRRKQTEEGRLKSCFGLLELGVILRNRFDKSGHLEDIRNAIRCQLLALHLVPENDNTTKVFALNCLGGSYPRRFRLLGDLEDINKSIKYLSQAVPLVAGGHEAEALILNNLGSSYSSRFDCSGDVEDVENAIKCYEKAIQLTPDNHAIKPMMLTNLGNSYIDRLDRHGNIPADVDNAIECHIKALQLTLDGHAERPGRLDSLGRAYTCRFERRGDAVDLDNAIKYHMQAVQLTPDGHANKLIPLSNLGGAYRRRFERHGCLADINKSIECHIQCMKLAPDGHADKPKWLNNLGNAYICRFQRYGDVVDVDKSIECYMRAVQLTPDGQISKPIRLNNLGNSYMKRFERYGDIVDVDQAIKCHIQAAQFTPDGHSDKPGFLNNLGGAYRTRFGRQGIVQDIENSIECLIQAVRLTPDGHAAKPQFLNNLGSSYLHRFARHGEVVDAERSIEFHTQAVHLTPDDHAKRPGLLSDLGDSYMRQFERQGDVADIDKSIECHMQAVQLTPDDHSAKPGRLSSLGSSYLSRFDRYGETIDVDKSIECHEKATQLTPEDHAQRPVSLQNLGIAYMRRFERHRNVADADKATDCLMQAVQLTPNDHVDKPMRLTGLGGSYRYRFDLLGDVADLDNSIMANLKAVQLTPDGHAAKPLRLNELAGSYIHRFERLRDAADIDEAIKYYMRAVQLSPEGHAEGPSWLSNLGRAYMARFAQSSQLSDFEAANAFVKEAAESLTGSPRTRFIASRLWARYSLQLDASPMLAYHRTMELVSQLVWLGTTIERRYDLLREIGDIAIEAASVAISHTEYACALEWLEQGRSVVWNQILQLRTPFDDLNAVDPVLSKRMKAVAQSLERAGSRPTSSFLSENVLDLETDAQLHRRLAAEWDQLLEQARAVPGFETLMERPKLSELMRAAKDGPVVVINAYRTCCDALIIQPNNDKIAHVPLVSFSQEQANDFHAQFMSLIGHRGGRDRGFQRVMTNDTTSKCKAMLSALWSDVVKPIFDFLGYTYKQPNEKLPHVTWCTTGSLSFLPLHAAGCYDGSQPNALDLVVSSYTPTLGALLAPDSSTAIQHIGILAVGQQHTNGHSDLPYTVEELAVIKEYAAGVSYLQLDGNSATVNAVLNAMEEHSWVHLACHAAQHREDPAQSAFLLSDGNLMLSTITQRSFRNKGLAFLSACQTATGDENLPDEAVHLAAGMLMAGYPSVIATMWSIYDEDAPGVARQVYAHLLKDGKMDCTRAAIALHQAVTGLRKKVGEQSFERWLPFIHIGS